ncbi:hypothetical protein G7070_15395 [Propioniciclava coleopterorum]|uniref:Uncharacterized protein n=1 Tax=Propioniciclava coleopterorum TaxID=2714937 RepID=A0A6G7Y923_9ACTN|nr:hypothetical protein [Propioniciclava coleopterorum]QIK73394.1 hypothetical protein G7070_15395 [Propioniciclava coleopterorum]
MSTTSVPRGPAPGRVALTAAAVGYAILLVGVALLAGGDTADPLPEGLVAALAGAGAVIVAICLLAPLMPQRWARYANIPYRSHWETPERWPRAQRLLADELGWFGTATLALLGTLLAISAVRAEGTPVPAWVAVAAVGVFMAWILGYATWLYLGPRWRPMTDPRDAPAPGRRR